MKRAAVLAMILVVGCGGGDRVRDACTRVVSVVCDKAVECHAMLDGLTITADICQAGLTNGVDHCVTENRPYIEAATDQQVDDCETAYKAFPCSSLCDQVPVDPPACQVLSPAPNTDFFTCGS
jgi:hypothetical protein